MPVPPNPGPKSKNMEITLSDRFTKKDSTVFISGIQALVRLPVEIMRRDRDAGLNTGTFISGYRGSPLGGYDFQLTRNKDLLDEHNIQFQPGVNEELAATAVWGSQQVNLFDGAKVDGVCGIWYGKTPGLDRSADAFRHAHGAGTSKFGGVLAIVGDDHGCKSSTYPGQSEFAFMDLQMPVLNPASVQEVLDFGIYGMEMSRFSGGWTALVTTSENMDSGEQIIVGTHHLDIVRPEKINMPLGGLHIRLNDKPLDQEERLWRYKLPAALAFAKANKLNRMIWDAPKASLGIITTGKAHLDVMQALQDLGIDDTRGQKRGIKILKLGMSYPLDIDIVEEFAKGLDTIFVAEEKRSFIETQLKESLYNLSAENTRFPKVVGKKDLDGNILLPAYGELSPNIVSEALIHTFPAILGSKTRKRASDDAKPAIVSKRTPYFCSGCPHNTSTQVPDGSRALAGIGCHYLAQNMDRNTHTYTQMGGEGANWIGQFGFTETDHVFVNLGDGTYFHSGILAIRAAVAAKVNATYKILFNEAVAMTGGQPHDGELHPANIVDQVIAEGVKHVVWVSEDPSKYSSVKLPKGAEMRHRDDMDAIQKALRDTPGVSVIVYDQTCATELRRNRKRGKIEDPKRRILINSDVCEGCGDCSVQSNCVSIEPLVTEFGTKRTINQTSCNMDLSCVKGFCPSFVEVQGGQLRRPQAMKTNFRDLGEALDLPSFPTLTQPWSILVTGVGGTGIVTVGAILSMAASIEGKAVSTLDQTGLAQKGGAVYSHIRFAKSADQLHAVRISDRGADALLACDMIGAADEKTCLAKLNRDKTQTVVNSAVMPTADFVLGNPDLNENETIVERLSGASKEAAVIDAYSVAQRAFGSTMTVNILLLGYAYQKGVIPLSVEALYTAIELNGVKIEENKAAFNLGRFYCASPEKAENLLSSEKADKSELSSDLDDLLSRFYRHLQSYQDTAYADRFKALIDKVTAAETSLYGAKGKLTEAAARSAVKLMAYKDEYEVGRLYANGDFKERLTQSFEGDYKIKFHMAPPLFARKKDARGLPRKISMPGWIWPFFGVLSKLKFLRGSRLDIFGYSTERRKERELIGQYFSDVEAILPKATAENLPLIQDIFELPMTVKGYGAIKEKSIDQYRIQRDLKLSELS